MVLRGIYEFLEKPYYSHDFDNVIYSNEKYDMMWSKEFTYCEKESRIHTKTMFDTSSSNRLHRSK